MFPSYAESDAEGIITMKCNNPIKITEGHREFFK